MLKSNGKCEVVVQSLKSVLTGCTALTFAAAVGMGAGSALADITIATGSTVLSNTISTSSGKVNLSGGVLSFNSTSKQTATGAAVTLSNAIILATGKTNTVTTSTYAYTTTATPPVTGNSRFVGTLSGVISGAGSITVDSGASVYLTGTNTYTGVTTVAAGGNLYIGNANDYGSIASNSIVVNATNNADGTVTSGVINFNRIDTYTYNGTVTGNGVLNQAGGGTLILNGNSVLTSPSVMQVNTGLTPAVNDGYLGGLRATKGTIEIGDASHKTASVTVPLANILAGASMSGFGTLNGSLINGDDTPGTVSSKNSITTQLVGGVLTPGDGSTPGNFTINGNYTQGTYGALLITATPNSVSRLTVSGTANIKGQLSVSGMTGRYATGLYPILTAGTVSGRFDRFLAGTPDTANALGIYYAPSGKEVDLVVAPKSIGQVYSDLVLQSFDTVTSMNDLVLDHTSTGCASCSGFRVWAQSYLGTDSFDAGNGAAAFSNHTLGVIGGLDYRFASGLSFHGVMASGNGDLGIHDQSARARNSQTYLSLASHVPAGPVAFDLAYFYLSSSSKVARNDGLGNSLASKMNQTAHGVSAQISAPFMDGDLLPFGRITYALLAAGPAIESGKGPMVLNVGHGHQTTGRFGLGARVGHTFDAGDDYYIRPQLTFAGEMNDRTVGQTNPISMGSGSDFFAPAPSTERFSMLGRLGVEVTRNDLSFQLGISERESSNQNQSLLNLGVAYHF